MSKTIPDIVPNPDSLREMEPEELAGVVIEYLNSLEPNEGKPNRYNFSLGHCIEGYGPLQDRDGILRLLMEGWVWLEREGLIAPEPGAQGEWVFVTRRGKSFTKESRTGCISKC